MFFIGIIVILVSLNLMNIIPFILLSLYPVYLLVLYLNDDNPGKYSWKIFIDLFKNKSKSDFDNSIDKRDKIPIQIFQFGNLDEVEVMCNDFSEEIKESNLVIYDDHGVDDYKKRF